MTDRQKARRCITLSALAVAGTLATVWMAMGTRAVADGDPILEAPLVTRKLEVVEPIRFTKHIIKSSDLRVGTSKTVRTGVDGKKTVVYEVAYRGDIEVSRRVLSSKVTREPKPEVVYVGAAKETVARGRYAARGYFGGRRVVTMIATGYDPNPASNGGSNRTSTGLKVGHGVVAVDPKFIPIGTKLFIEGYGYAVAADVGGAIKGNRIDLGHDTARGARNVGRRLVRVHILN